MIRIALLSLASLFLASGASASSVRLKDMGRFQGWRDNPLVGYGIVTGLAGSGDSSRNEVTKQALRNALARLGVSVTPDQIQSRNVAVVIVTATLPPVANQGDRIDAVVTSVGDARSLAGGTLLMTPLLGPNQRTYGLAQGPLVVGGYRFEADQNSRQKNYPTVGLLPEGVTVEQAVESSLLTEPDGLVFLLRNPDFITAESVASGINLALGDRAASVRSAGEVHIATKASKMGVNALVARIENVLVETDQPAKVVINERSGTVVAGAGVRISNVVVAQGDIKVSVTIDNQASQPNIYGGFVRDAQGLVVTNTRLDVDETDQVMRFPDSTVADLVQGLARAKVKTRDMIAILQAMKAAGALHAELIVQ